MTINSSDKLLRSLKSIQISLHNPEFYKIIELDDCFVVAGGGETISAINKFISTKDISYCSTAGGAFLEFVEGKELPSLEALGFKREEEKND